MRASERGCARRVSRSAYGDAMSVGSPGATVPALAATADASHTAALRVRAIAAPKPVGFCCVKTLTADAIGADEESISFEEGEVKLALLASLRSRMGFGAAKPHRFLDGRIVAKVDELMALCDRLEEQLTLSETESQRLLESILHQTLLNE